MNKFRFDTVQHPGDGKICVLVRNSAPLAMIGIEQGCEVYRFDLGGNLIVAPISHDAIDWEAERTVQSLCPNGVWFLFFMWLELHLSLTALSTVQEKWPELDPTLQEIPFILSEIEKMWEHTAKVQEEALESAA